MRKNLLHKSEILGSKLIVRSVQLAGIFLKVLSDKIGPFLRRVSLFLPPTFAFWPIFAQVEAFFAAILRVLGRFCEG